MPFPCRVDAASLPPLLSNAERGSFAEFTFKVRDPRILQDLIEAPWFSPDLRRALEALRDEVLHGPIAPLREDAPDVPFWRELSKAYWGRMWLDVPWFWAETYLYRRILECTRYFQPGAWHERDPFGPLKDEELKPENAPARVRALLGALGHAPDLPARLELILHTALWGNRVDLSYNVEQSVGRAEHAHQERENLVADDAAVVVEHLIRHPARQLVLVADNAGTELALDLALLDFLFETQLTSHVTLHLKPQPFYVSDAMPQDVERTLGALERSGEDLHALATRLRGRIARRELELRVHSFYPLPLHYFEAPDELFRLLGAADLVILKGDVNYRRLIGDMHWDPTRPFAEAVAYFPAPVVTLRTLKSDVIVGLRPGQAEALDREDRQWRVNGKRGVMQARLT